MSFVGKKIHHRGHGAEKKTNFLNHEWTRIDTNAVPEEKMQI
jgi:hypothetical protein